MHSIWSQIKLPIEPGCSIWSQLELPFEPGWGLLLGVVLLLIVSTHILLRRQRALRGASQPLPAKASSGATGSTGSRLMDAPADLTRWQVEMYETARDLKAELDSKLSALQALVLAARQECARLESLLERASRRPDEPPPSV